MSGPHRPAAVTAVAAAVALALGMGLPDAAGAGPDVPGDELARSVRTINPGAHVRDIDVASSVTPLETEESSGAEVTVRLSADVLFDFDKASLTDAARRRIAALAPRLRGTSGTVQVSGHSDGRGEAAYNQRLSEQRARAVKAELQRTLGGADVRIEARGFGASRPVAPNKVGGKDNPGGRAKNRRVDITFQKS